MLILPVDTPQEIMFRARPHDTSTAYLLVCWTNSQKVVSIIDNMTYDNGFVLGSVSFPMAVGLENGAKINFRAFPVFDKQGLLDAFGGDSPFTSTIEEINNIIIEQIEDDNILKEVYRGQIFVSNKTSQPYNVT